MKKVIIAVAALFAMTHSFAQQKEITHNNSWLKAGVNVGVPVGDASDFTSLAVGVDVSAQYLVNPNFGIGVASGYTHFIKKDGGTSFGILPLGALLRYYPQAKGFFLGTDLGYAFVTKGDNNGGFYIKPQLGYHNYNWNYYAFYNAVFQKDNSVSTTAINNLQSVGIAATYNIRFK